MNELNFIMIGQRIKEIRSEKKLTQEFVSDKTGVNVSHISNIENGKVKVSLSLLVAICNAFDVTIDYVLETEYHTPADTVEKEIVNIIKDYDEERKSQLLRIAKVL